MARRRRIVVTLLAVALAAAPCGAWLAAERAVAARRARWTDEVRQVQARAAAVRVAPLRGAPLDENAATLLRRADARFGARGLHGFSTGTVDPDPWAPPRGDTVAALASCVADLAAVREALRCERCDWETSYDSSVWSWCLHGDDLARLLVADGHRCARAGDGAAAAEAYLDALRLSAHLERGGGFGETRLALEALARLVASPRGGATLPLGRIEAELGRAMAALPDLVARVREVRLDQQGRLARFLDGTGDEWIEEQTERGRWTATRPGLLHAYLVLDDAWLEAERALAADDVEAWARIAEAIHAWDWGEAPLRAQPSCSALVLQRYPDPAGWWDDRKEVETWAAIVRTAIALEPLPAPRDPARISLPPDPFDPRRTLRLEVDDDGVGYTLSVPGPLRYHSGTPQPRGIALQRGR